jgi:hypothetical protein
MRTASRFVLISMVLGSAFAVAAPPDLKGPPVKVEAPPPPGIDDPGVQTPAAPPGQNAPPPAAADTDASNDPLAPLQKPDTRIVRDKAARDASANSERIASSDVSTRQQGDDTVEEYRQNGRVWMIRIVPPNGGPTQTFMDTNNSGRLTRDPQAGPVDPVYFTLYEWNN